MNSREYLALKKKHTKPEPEEILPRPSFIEQMTHWAFMQLCSEWWYMSEPSLSVRNNVLECCIEDECVGATDLHEEEAALFTSEMLLQMVEEVMNLHTDLVNHVTEQIVLLCDEQAGPDWSIEELEHISQAQIVEYFIELSNGERLVYEFQLEGGTFPHSNDVVDAISTTLEQRAREAETLTYGECVRKVLKETEDVCYANMLPRLECRPNNSRMALYLNDVLSRTWRVPEGFSQYTADKILNEVSVARNRFIQWVIADFLDHQPSPVDSTDGHSVVRTDEDGDWTYTLYRQGNAYNCTGNKKVMPLDILKQWKMHFGVQSCNINRNYLMKQIAMWLEGDSFDRYWLAPENMTFRMTAANQEVQIPLTLRAMEELRVTNMLNQAVEDALVERAKMLSNVKRLWDEIEFVHPPGHDITVTREADFLLVTNGTGSLQVNGREALLNPVYLQRKLRERP